MILNILYTFDVSKLSLDHKLLGVFSLLLRKEKQESLLDIFCMTLLRLMAGIRTRSDGRSIQIRDVPISNSVKKNTRVKISSDEESAISRSLCDDDHEIREYTTYVLRRGG